MFRRLIISTLSIFILQLSSVSAQGLHDWSQVVLIQAEQCRHGIATRRQTGFRIVRNPGIFTALHGIIDCKIIQMFPKVNMPDTYLRLAPVAANIDYDVAQLCLVSQISDDLCQSDKTEGFEVESVGAAESLAGLQIIGYPNGSDAQYTIKKIQAATTSTTTLGSLVGEPLKARLEERGSPNPNIQVIPVEGILPPGMSGAAVLNANGRLIGMGDGSHTHGLSWLINWNSLQLTSIKALEPQINELINKEPEIFLSTSAQIDESTKQFQRYSGFVKDPNGNPIPQAEVTLQFSDQLQHLVYSDSKGEFLFTFKPITAGMAPSGKFSIKAENYEIYTENIEIPLLTNLMRDFHLKRKLPSISVPLQKRIYVRVVAQEGVDYYHEDLETKKDIFTFNTILFIVDGSEKHNDLTWWKVRELEKLDTTAVWVPDASNEIAYLEAIPLLGTDDCALIKNETRFRDLSLPPDYKILQPNEVLRIVNTVDSDEKGGSLWVKMYWLKQDTVGHVEYVNTRAGVNAERYSCPESMLPTSTVTPTKTVTKTETPTPNTTLTWTPISTAIPTDTPTATETLTPTPSATATLTPNALPELKLAIVLYRDIETSYYKNPHKELAELRQAKVVTLNGDAYKTLLFKIVGLREENKSIDQIFAYSLDSFHTAVSEKKAFACVSEDYIWTIYQLNQVVSQERRRIDNLYEFEYSSEEKRWLIHNITQAENSCGDFFEKTSIWWRSLTALFFTVLQ